MLTSPDDAARAEAAATATATATSAAGWHADPLGRRRFRYWDGRRWSPYGSDDGLGLTADAVPELEPVAADESDRHRGAALVLTIALVAAVAGITFWRAGPDGSAGGSMSWGDLEGRTGAAGGTDTEPSPPPGGEAGEREPTDGVEVQDDPSAPRGELGPIAVVYRHERSDGDSWEVLIASDPPRSIVRGEDSATLIVAGEQTVSCDARACIEDVAPSSVDLLRNYMTFGSPWSNAESSERDIAGRDAECATDSTSGDTLCWDVQTGLMLRTEPGGAGLTITAVEVRAPEPGDFELPHELSSGSVGDLG